MFKLLALLRDIDGLLKEMTTKSYKVSVPEKYLQEFGASLKTAKTELLDYRTKFERINSVQDTKQYQRKSADFLVPAENAAEGGRKSVKKLPGPPSASTSTLSRARSRADVPPKGLQSLGMMVHKKYLGLEFCFVYLGSTLRRRVSRRASHETELGGWVLLS